MQLPWPMSTGSQIPIRVLQSKALKEEWGVSEDGSALICGGGWHFGAVSYPLMARREGCLACGEARSVEPRRRHRAKGQGVGRPLVAASVAIGEVDRSLLAQRLPVGSRTPYPRCGEGSRVDSSDDPLVTRMDERDRRSAIKAVDIWAGFPAGATSRPIVLLHGPMRSEGDFKTSDAKIAFLQGAVESAAEVPEEALRLMRLPQVRGPLPAAPLRVVDAVLSEAGFATDRGLLTLPAWRVTALDTQGPIWVLSADAHAHCWSPPPDPGGWAGPHLLSGATSDADDLGLTVQFVGGGVTVFRYEPEVVETATAVAVVPLERSIQEFRPGIAFTHEGHPRQVRVRLSEPLRGRVLVNLDGAPVEVLPLLPG